MLDNAEYLATGVVVYRDVFKKEHNYIERLEKALGSEENNKYSWKPGYTGYGAKNLQYRDCVDFKIKHNEDGSLSAHMDCVQKEDLTELDRDLTRIWDDAYYAQLGPVDDYRNMFGLAPLKYWESFNFIKYGPGQHFQIHSDHGYSYTCVLSAVGYINDDYEGGELYFDKINLKIKPKAGDLYLFPSSYIYSHAAMPVTSGTKYSIVTMLDYLETAHTPEYRNLEAKYSKSLL
jgi:2OG-Fe(II) oxygenase superfamily